jgi:hypothetical protein
MKKLLFMFMLVFSATMFAQETKVSGVVLDENNQPVSGANIRVKGTAKGVSADDCTF